jgi:hypothetical protein
VRPCSRQTCVLEWINRSADGVSASHTLVSVCILCLSDRPTELVKRSLQPRNTRFQVLDLIFLVFTCATHVRQGCDGASCLLYLEADVIRCRRDVLDLERPLCGKLGRRWRRRWRLGRCLENALEQPVEVREHVKRRGRREGRGVRGRRRRRRRQGWCLRACGCN